MFLLERKEQLENAIAKAKRVRPQVKFDGFGKYRVSGSAGNFYKVTCQKDSRGLKSVDCECTAGEQGLVCYHAASAIAVHVGLARMRH